MSIHMLGSDERTIDWSPIYESLADGQRRRALQFLAQTTGAVDLAEITDYLLETDDELQDDGSADRIALRLYHVHLPRLADAGLIRWTADRQTVSLTDLGLRLPIALLRPQPLERPGSTPRMAND